MTCFRIDVGRGEDVDRVAERLAHLPDAVGAQDDRRLGEHRLRLGERVAVAAIERPDDLARQLQVGGLVLADRHERGLVDDDVGRLQDRVGQQPVIDVVGLVGLLLLVRRGPLQPAHRRDRAQQPGELGVLRPVALDEQRAALRVEAEGQQRGGHLARPRPQEDGVVRARQRVVVDDAVDRLVLALERDVVPDRARGRCRGGRCRTAGCPLKMRGRASGRASGAGAGATSRVMVAECSGRDPRADRGADVPGRRSRPASATIRPMSSPSADPSMSRAPLRVGRARRRDRRREVVPARSRRSRSASRRPTARRLELVGVAVRDLGRRPRAGIPAELLTDAPAHLVASPEIDVDRRAAWAATNRPGR